MIYKFNCTLCMNKWTRTGTEYRILPCPQCGLVAAPYVAVKEYEGTPSIDPAEQAADAALERAAQLVLNSIFDSRDSDAKISLKAVQRDLTYIAHRIRELKSTFTKAV